MGGWGAWEGGWVIGWVSGWVGGGEARGLGAGGTAEPELGEPGKAADICGKNEENEQMTARQHTQTQNTQNTHTKDPSPLTHPRHTPSGQN